MKNFMYYEENSKCPGKTSFKNRVYAAAKFNPDNYDSKSEEKRVREELDRKAEELYKQCVKKAQDTYEEFKRDIFEEFGIQNNPKRELFYQIAWSQAINNGESFAEVYDVMERWVEIIKD